MFDLTACRRFYVVHRALVHRVFSMTHDSLVANRSFATTVSSTSVVCSNSEPHDIRVNASVKSFTMSAVIFTSVIIFVSVDARLEEAHNWRLTTRYQRDLILAQSKENLNFYRGR